MNHLRTLARKVIDLTPAPHDPGDRFGATVPGPTPYRVVITRDGATVVPLVTGA